MLYPLVVPLLLLSGLNTITKNNLTGLSNQVCEIFFHNGSKNTGVGASNFTEFIFNKRANNHVYNVKKCAFYELNNIDLARTGAKYELSDKEIDNATAERINDFMFLCLLYNLEMKQKGMAGYDKNYIYKEMKDKLSDSDYIMFWQAVRIAAYAANGAPEFLKKEDADKNNKYMDQVKEIAANVARGIRELRRLTPRPKGGVYYSDLMSGLDSFFDSEHVPHTLIDLLKLTIIDPNSIDIWSGEEQRHFLDSATDRVYEIVASPEFYFEYSHDHEQYLNNLTSLAINPNETHFFCVENELRKYTDDILSFTERLLKNIYKELSVQYGVNDDNREKLSKASIHIRCLPPVYSLDDNEKNDRKYLLLEMYIRLVCAVLTNNWEDINLIPMSSFPEMIERADRCISRINPDNLNSFLDGKNDNESTLTNALAMYEECGRIIAGNGNLINWFDVHYSENFLNLLASPLAQKRLFAEGSNYSNIFSLYRWWLFFKKAYIYTHFRNGFSLRSDIISMKICNDYMKLYREDKSAVLPFTVIDNSEVSRRFRLRQASIDDFKEVKQMNDKEFSRKVFVKSPDKELEFGINNSTIWLVKDESTDTMVAFFIIVPIENNERLAQMKGVYGTATLAHEYAIENNCIDKPFVIFDAVIVEPKYRGLGFQRLGLLLAEYLGKEIAAEFICATVSPANIPSSRNFQLLDYKKLQTVYYPSCDTENTPGRRYKEPTDYYTAHKSECDDEAISPEILSFLRENHISDEDYKQERVAVRDFVVFNIT